jgi:hypothetical protein
MGPISMLCAAALLALVALKQYEKLPRRVYRLVLCCALVAGSAAGISNIVPTP